MAHARLRSAIALLQAGLVAAATYLAAAPPAAAAPDPFSEQPVGTVAPMTVNGQLEGASCPTSVYCMAVGHYINGAGQEASFAEQRTKSGWQLVGTVNPTQTGGVVLTDVDCWSPSACVALGDNAGKLLAETWNGTRWRLAEVDQPAGARFTGVSCAAARVCFATGTRVARRTMTQGLIWRYDGTRWRLQDVPRPYPFTELNSVSCTGRGNCTAVGSETDAKRAFALSWGGVHWRTIAAPVPARSTSSQLIGVSCPRNAHSACVAVGRVDFGYRTHALIENRTAGHGFAPSTPPGPRSAAALTSVSCTTYQRCTAVGQILNDDRLPPVSVIAVRGASGGFRFATAGGRQQLRSVSCFAATCTSVGVSNATTADDAYTEDSPVTIRTVVRRGSGLAPATERSVNGSGSPDSRFSAVSCPTAGFCAASIAGSVTGGDAAQTGGVAVRNGSVWSYPATGLAAGTLLGVSCSSPTSCVAVGNRGPGGGYAPVSLVWDGTHWTATAMAVPSGAPAKDVVPQAVSCASESFCEATGYYYPSAGSTTEVVLVEKWDGTTWTAQPASPPNGHPDGQLTAVSCASSTSCLAVGYSASGTALRAQKWNGVLWQGATAPRLPGGTELTGVSCTSDGFCTAVGFDNRDSVTAAWNGATWTAHAVPRPVVGGAPQDDAMLAISCTSKDDCVGAGWTFAHVGAFATQTPFTTRWNGTTWTDDAVRPIPGEQLALLDGVSCATATSCTAVGSVTRVVGVPIVEASG